MVFGFKHFLAVAAVACGALGGAYLVGSESGYKRAERGEPSILAFLERQADEHTGRVPIPEVLLEQDARDRAKARALASGAEGRAPDREKPTPAVAVTADGQVRPGQTAPEPDSAAQTPRQAPPSGGRQLHFQIAALRETGNAEGLLDWLRNQGFRTHVDRTASDGLVRVYIGPFQDEKDAEVAKVRLEGDGFKPILRRF